MSSSKKPMALKQKDSSSDEDSPPMRNIFKKKMLSSKKDSSSPKPKAQKKKEVPVAKPKIVKRREESSSSEEELAPTITPKAKPVITPKAKPVITPKAKPLIKKKEFSSSSSDGEDVFPNIVPKMISKPKEPKYIEGPVNFIYLKGDPGDGVERKVLLLGDIHVPMMACKPAPYKGAHINMGDFCRYVANRIAPKIIDIFVEDYHDENDDRRRRPIEEEEGYYLDNLIYSFRNCLKYDKTLCTEPMRIHYVDPRNIISNKKISLLVTMQNLPLVVLDSLYRFKKGSWDDLQWPEEDDLKDIADSAIRDARLTSIKFNSINIKIRQKFKNKVIGSLREHLMSFFRNKVNQDFFDQVKKIRENTRDTDRKISSEEDIIVRKFLVKITITRSWLLDAYFLYRMLKRATNHKPGRPEVALKVGEPTTHVIGYTGSSHTFSCRNMLLSMGFKIEAHKDFNGLEEWNKIHPDGYPDRINQCLEYSLIKTSVNDFCVKDVIKISSKPKISPKTVKKEEKEKSSSSEEDEEVPIITPKTVKKEKEKSSKKEPTPKVIPKPKTVKKKEDSSEEEESPAPKAKPKSGVKTLKGKEEKVNILTEPKYIEGPVNFIYLKGDPGDGVMRKVLLLGDIHDIWAPFPTQTMTSMANFCRYVADRISPTIIDIFIESFYDVFGKISGFFAKKKKGYHLNNLVQDFRKCLTKSKNSCIEPMRIHYIDTRYNSRAYNETKSSSLDLIGELMMYMDVSGYGFTRNEAWNEPKWPKRQDISDIIKVTLLNAKLTDAKFKSINPAIRQKFKDVVITSVVQKITTFYEDMTNRDMLNQINKGRARVISTGSSPSRQELKTHRVFYGEVIALVAFIMDAYFIYRLLKRASARKPERPKVALKIGEPTTHVIAYTGAMHVFQIRDFLLKMGFKVLDQKDRSKGLIEKDEPFSVDVPQYLSYKSIKDSVDDFCIGEKTLRREKSSSEEDNEEEAPAPVITPKPKVTPKSGVTPKPKVTPKPIKKKESSSSSEDWEEVPAPIIVPKPRTIKKKEEAPTSEPKIAPKPRTIKKKEKLSSSSEGEEFPPPKITPKPRIIKNREKFSDEEEEVLGPVITPKPATAPKLKVVKTKEEFSLGEKKADILKEPKYIEGPVNFIYLKGNPGDGVVRKVLLLGDIHIPSISCGSVTSVGENITMPDFCRYVTRRMTPKIIDIFIESPYDEGKNYFPIPEEKEGYYLDNLRHTFGNCLTKNKTLCKEPMRIHYTDTRLILGDKRLSSIELIKMTAEAVMAGAGKGFWDETEWPENKNIEYITTVTLDNARLTYTKLQNINSKIRQKFKDKIIKPLRENLISFLKNKDNRATFGQIKNIRANMLKDGTQISLKEKAIAQNFFNDLIYLQSPIYDAYFVYRMLKRATNRKPERPEVALKIGEPTTHIVGYPGVYHTFQARDMLLSMGFKLKNHADLNELEVNYKKDRTVPEHINQCLDYSLMSSSVDDFCKKESTSEEEI